MKKTVVFQLSILILFAVICLSACITPNTQADDNTLDNTPATMILPYDDDIFIFTPAYFEEDRVVTFRYAEGRENFDEWNGVYYTAANFSSHAADFIDVMNRISPVLMDAVFTDASVSNIPFEGPVSPDADEQYPVGNQTRGSYLYRLHISDFDYYDFHMRVHQTEDFGYLYFAIFEWEEVEPDSAHYLIRDIIFHSLYRITLDELEQIIEFAEGLERTTRWTATPPSTP
jgi:hypothetical protein